MLEPVVAADSRIPEHPRTRTTMATVTATAEQMDRAETPAAIRAEGLRAAAGVIDDTFSSIARLTMRPQPLTNHDAVIHDGRWLRSLNPCA